MPASKANKLLQWLRLSVNNPIEAIDRIATIIDVRSDLMFVEPPEYETVQYAEVFDRISSLNSVDPGAIRAEATEIEKQVRERMQALNDGPIAHIHSADFALARLCYAAVRVLRPKSVLETGVAYGVTSAFILEALEQNGEGSLHSVDLPPLGPNVDSYVGILIRDAVRSRWTLTRGPSRRVLPGVLKTIGTVDLFVHDSLHTYKNISYELEKVSQHLSPNGAVIADDIDENPAFLEWSKKHRPGYSAVVREDVKDSLLGVAFFANEGSGRT
ncbi:MAG: class I SAM-dependent methyltransferase [Bacteroidetes bacterium]|nr:class I SAM-dependent methyltransferase [Bacteroidota bacterium]